MALSRKLRASGAATAKVGAEVAVVVDAAGEVAVADTDRSLTLDRCC
jgi:hypothetical protein